MRPADSNAFSHEGSLNPGPKARTGQSVVDEYRRFLIEFYRRIKYRDAGRIPEEIQTACAAEFRWRSTWPDAQLLLRLMLENRFPRIWVPDAENRDLRQLLWHGHRLVQMRTRVLNQLHVVPLNEGLRRKKALWRPAGRAGKPGHLDGEESITDVMIGHPAPSK